MLSSQEQQRDRVETLRQDLSVRRQQEEGGSMHAHALADADTPRGRFSAVSAVHVVGSTAVPQYPQASAPFQFDPVGDEPPLGLDNPPSAAQALFPHLPKGERAEQQQQPTQSLAASMYPALAPKPERRHTPDELRELWHEHLWGLVGIRRKR